MNVKQFYETINGNYSKALETMMSEDFIKRMLTKFMQNNSFKDVMSNYESKNYHGVFEASHSLKGVCGNLALTPLYEKASALCEKTRVLKEGETLDIELEINELKEVYERVTSLINNFINQ